MPPRRLFWTFEARQELDELLGRRTRKERVLDCIDSHAQLVAEELSMATVDPGPSHFRFYDFRCDDVGSAVYVQLLLSSVPCSCHLRARHDASASA